MRSSIKKLCRSSVGSKPGFSESKNVDIASFSKVSESSIVERLSKRPDVESAHVKR